MFRSAQNDVVFVYIMAVWAFDTDSECWSLMEAKGDLPVIFFKVLNIHFKVCGFIVWIESELETISDSDMKLQISRNGHTVVRASSVLILFGGEDSKKRKLNDLHMFDLKSSTWLPLNCT